MKRSDVTLRKQGYITPPPSYFIVLTLASSVKTKEVEVIVNIVDSFKGKLNSILDQPGPRGLILERVKILIFEIIVVFTIISNIKILSLRLGVSAILEIFKMRLSVTFLLKLRQLPTCRNFYDELYQPTLQNVQWHLCL